MDAAVMEGAKDDYSLDRKQGVYIHGCADEDTAPNEEEFPTFPFGPLLRKSGFRCNVPIPMACAFCERVSEQPCKSIYRVALTGADWHGFRDPSLDPKHSGVLVECSHCGAPGEFHVHLALFKGYYSEVMDLVRNGKMTLFDVRRSVSVVAEWPPQPERPLIRLISHVANQLVESLAASPLPTECGALVLEYWQGAGPDFLSDESTFATSFDSMYECNHGWPCRNDDGSRQHCLWTQWAQQWIYELMICDGRIAIPNYHCTKYLPRTWGEWIERRSPEWRVPDGVDRSTVPIPSGSTATLTVQRAGNVRMGTPREGYRVLRAIQLPGHRPLGLVKPERRMTTAWYTSECTTR
jgi:transcription elongation factor Elf1